MYMVISKEYGSEGKVRSYETEKEAYRAAEECREMAGSEFETAMVIECEVLDTLYAENKGANVWEMTYDVTYGEARDSSGRYTRDRDSQGRYTDESSW